VEHPYLYFVRFLEWIGHITGAEGIGHFASSYPWVIYSWVVMLFLIVVGIIGTRTIAIIPGKFQNFLEIVVSGLENFMVDITGEEGRWFFPLIATIFVYIAVCNLSGLIPGFFPPTASLNTTLSCALVVVIFTHVIGIKYHGVKYIKHFMGPIWWMVPIVFPIELIGHIARIMSLSFRLFGNMMGHELVLAILFMLAGAFFAPLPIMAMGIFVAFVQAFVFFLLSIMYFSGAMEHAH
jgi:F-type H+-transporting ATPase subunit a